MEDTLPSLDWAVIVTTHLSQIEYKNRGHACGYRPLPIFIVAEYGDQMNPGITKSYNPVNQVDSFAENEALIQWHRSWEKKRALQSSAHSLI
jgi:hypothetical protein